MNVLIIEDDVWLADSYRRTLEAAGHNVEYVPHAVAAIDTIDDAQPDVILLDVLLAGTTALTLLHELQSHADLASIPVILITNLADQIHLDDVQAYGVKRILDKATMRPADILAAVHGAVL